MEAAVFGKTGERVCSFMRGVITGTYSEALEDDFNVREKTCRSKGDNVCTFVLEKEEWLKQIRSII